MSKTQPPRVGSYRFNLTPSRVDSDRIILENDPTIIQKFFCSRVFGVISDGSDSSVILKLKFKYWTIM